MVFVWFENAQMRSLYRTTLMHSGTAKAISRNHSISYSHFCMCHKTYKIKSDILDYRVATLPPMYNINKVLELGLAGHIISFS